MESGVTEKGIHKIAKLSMVFNIMAIIAGIAFFNEKLSSSEEPQISSQNPEISTPAPK